MAKPLQLRRAWVRGVAKIVMVAVGWCVELRRFLVIVLRRGVRDRPHQRPSPKPPYTLLDGHRLRVKGGRLFFFFSQLRHGFWGDLELFTKPALVVGALLAAQNNIGASGPWDAPSLRRPGEPHGV